MKDLLTKLEIAEKQRQHFQAQAQVLRHESNDFPSKSVRVTEPQVVDTVVDEQ